MELAEHIHIALELEFGSLDENGDVFGDLFILKLKACLGVYLGDFLTLLLVAEVGLDAQLVVLRFEFNPLACFLRHSANAVVEFLLALAEDSHVGRLVASLKRVQFTLVQFVSKTRELAASLAHDDAPKNQESLPLESTIWVDREFAMSFASLAHG